MKKRNPTQDKPFWASVSLEELSKQQGVLPADNLDNISSLWFVDDPDDLLRYILRERHLRHKIKKRK